MSQHILKSFNLYQNIHFIGIGGIGISALARILAKDGHNISGSDQSGGKNIDRLIQEGVPVKIGHHADSIPADTSLVIYTPAMPEENVEMQASKRRKIPMLSYPQAVGLLTQSYRSICVCGTHGKTTTTALLGLILKEAALDPTVIVGSLLREFAGSNELLGHSDLLVLESCEYRDSFLNYSPQMVVLTNIDPEHLDYFGTAERYLDSFRIFLAKIPLSGLLVANGDDENIALLLREKKHPFKVLTFGYGQNNDYLIRENTIIEPDGTTSSLKLNIPGRHNLLNAAAAFILAKYLKVQNQAALTALQTFSGASRRFEVKGQLGKTTVIDDYGHAPAEIQATLAAARERFGRTARILCVFQPHQYSRTYHFLNQFALSFDDADKVLIPNIYRSRDSVEDMSKVSVDDLVTALNRHRPALSENTLNFPDTLNRIRSIYQNYDAILTIGAGDITKLSDDILNIR